MWIRGAFLDYQGNHPKMIVHGHSISYEPEVRSNRIGIDTGAFATGRLTALVLQDDTHRFLST
jgi:serine/threonine protein phosphatase 1